MMADEATDAEDDEYDSDEDVDDRDGDDDGNWDSLSTPRGKLAQKDGVAAAAATSTTVASTTQRATEPPTFAMASSAAPIDPYFTHFDPRAEHQSYKVKVSNSIPFVLQCLIKKF